MRIRLILLLAAVAAFAAAAPSAHAGGTRPWCMIIQNFTGGSMCAFDTFEQCREEARAGNEGFCAANPNYQAPVHGRSGRSRARPDAHQ